MPDPKVRLYIQITKEHVFFQLNLIVNPHLKKRLHSKKNRVQTEADRSLFFELSFCIWFLGFKDSISGFKGAFEKYNKNLGKNSLKHQWREAQWVKA